MNLGIFERGNTMNKIINITNVILKTERLILRPWKETDLNDFYEYAKVDGVGQLAGWTPHKNIEESKRILDIFIEGKKTFAIEYRGKVIGSLGIECYNEENYPEFNALQGREIGYVLSKDFWGQDIMPEAVKDVIQYLFEVENLDFILVRHSDSNAQSARVVQKCGFKYIKTIENSIQNILYNSFIKQEGRKKI